MKKTMAVLAAVLTCLTSCASKTQLGTFAELPKNAQNFIVTYFNETDIAFVKVEKDGLHNDYDVQLNSGVEMEFNHKGELKEIDCRLQPVPEGIVPAVIVGYVESHFTNAFIVKYKIERRGQKVELNNSLELEFDKNGNFLRLDD